MNILAIESSARAASAAVSAGGRVFEEFDDSGFTHSQTLMPMIDSALRAAGLVPADIDLIAVANGPGSFTGLRIGVAAAKGFAWALGKPCAGVSTLAAMAYLQRDFGGTVCCAMDARREQFYTALFRAEGGVISRLTPDGALSAEEMVSGLPEGRLVFVGDGAEKAFAAAGRGELAPYETRIQRASSLLGAVEEFGVRTAPEGLEPVYLRLSQAERERNEKLHSEEDKI